MSTHSRAITTALAIGFLGAAYLGFPSAQTPPRRGTENGEWRTLGGDVGHTRYSPLDQITPANFETLKEAWRFSPLDVVGPMTARATPSYVGGKLLSVAGPRRHVVSIDPTSGKLLWSWVEPETYRSKYSMRTAYGKGVAYTEINGKGVVYIATPGFFLVALDADTGQPLPNWGRPVGLPGFPRTGVVDLAEDLIRDWDPWIRREAEVQPERGRAARTRLHHELLAADRRQRRHHRRQLRRAGLSPDAAGERARRHPRLQRARREVPVEVPRHSAAGRSGSRDVGERRVAHDAATCRRGRRCRPTPSAASSTCRPTAPRVDMYGGFRPGNNLYRGQPDRARRQDRQAALALPDGASRHLELRHTDRADRDGRHRQWPPHSRRLPGDEAGDSLRVQSRDRASRSGDSRSGRFRRRRCPAKSCRRRNRSRSSRRRTSSSAAAPST